MAKIEKENKLNNQLMIIEKMYGKGSIMWGDSEDVRDVESISSGSIELDLALGIGGYPVGRIVEIFGPESSGKTTLCLHAIKEAQLAGMKTAFIDVEHALDMEYAVNIGVDKTKLILSQPDYGEQALDIARKLISVENFMVVVDSVAALVPKAELNGEIEDNSIGLQARMMSQALRMLKAEIRKTHSILIFTNQLRFKVGVMFGSPEETPGGKALKFYASQRLDVRRQSTVKTGEEMTANTTKVKIVKNKMAPPYRTAILDIKFGVGIDIYSEIVDYCVKNTDLMKKSGAWYIYGKDKFQGKLGICDFIAQGDNYSKLYNKLFGE